MVNQPAQPSLEPEAPPLCEWDLPKANGARIRTVLARALKRQCPYCGGGNIFSNWWSLRERCPSCGVAFDREEGYFLGAYALNLVFAEILALALALFLLFGTELRNLPLVGQMVIAGGLAALFPIVLFPYARTVWMAIDLAANPPGDNPERYLRRHDFHRDLPAK